MQLETVNISGYRSIESITLLNCGGFNVLIGKNNAGKSNILMGINLFFDALRKSQSVVVFPGLTHGLDHYMDNSEQPIVISLDFRLSLAERDSLIQEVVSNAPQVKNAVEGLDPQLRLGVVLASITAPMTYAYVKEIVLRKQQLDDKGQRETTSRMILRVDDTAAGELATRASNAQKQTRGLEFIHEYIGILERFASEDLWGRVRKEPLFLSRVGSFEIQPGSIPVETRSKLEQAIRASDNAAAAKEAAQALIGSLEREAAEQRSQPLANRIESISGKEASIPAYALNLVSKVSKCKVLFASSDKFVF